MSLQHLYKPLFPHAERGDQPDLQFSAVFRASGFGVRILAAVCLLGLALSSRAQALSDQALSQIRFDQKLNASVSPTLPFRDEAGRAVQLGQYFGRKPVVLVLGYFECPMLCTLVLNGMVESAADMKWSIGREYDVIVVSIDPKETPPLAAAKKRTYVKRYGRSGAAEGWHFLTGDDASIRQLANEVGFRYAYDPVSKQFAHPSGLIILTPDGKVSRYLFGVTYAPKDLYTALSEAGANKVGSPIQQFILLCFHYNPITGKYSGLIIVILRVLAVATMLGFLGLIFWLVRRGRAAEAALARSAVADRSAPPPVSAGTSEATNPAARS